MVFIIHLRILLKIGFIPFKNDGYHKIIRFTSYEKIFWVYVLGNKLGSRIGDIQFWKSELEHETGSMLTEIELLNKARRALETFLKESDNQIHIAMECLYHREKRQG